MKTYTKEEINEVVGKPGFKYNDLTIDLMNAYVASYHPEDIEKWVAKFVSIPKKEKTINGKKAKVRDIKEIRKYFLETYFEKETEEARKADKERKRKEREAMSDADRLMERMKYLKENVK